MDAFCFLQRSEDAGKICGGRAALWPQHAHQTLDRNVRTFFEALKSDRSIDVIPQDRLAGLKIAIDDALDRFPEEAPAGNPGRSAPAPGWFP